MKRNVRKAGAALAFLLVFSMAVSSAVSASSAETEQELSIGIGELETLIDSVGEGDVDELLDMVDVDALVQSLDEESLKKIVSVAVAAGGVVVPQETLDALNKIDYSELAEDIQIVRRTVQSEEFKELMAYPAVQELLLMLGQKTTDFVFDDPDTTQKILVALGMQEAVAEQVTNGIRLVGENPRSREVIIKVYDRLLQADLESLTAALLEAETETEAG